MASTDLSERELSLHPAGVGEAETGVAGRTFGERGSEHSGGDVVIVVDLGGVLARVCSQDATGVLDQSSFEGDRGGQKQGVEHWAIEPLTDVRACRPDQEWRGAGAGVELLTGAR